MVATKTVIACAGWSLSSAVATEFPEEGSHLERYASRLRGVEINSSFYRPHRPATYARWRDSVPAGFRFTLKVPKAITHERRLQEADDLLEKFLGEAVCLGEKLACLLVQLPPGLPYHAASILPFFATLRRMTRVAIALEPRHASWFAEPAAEQLAAYDLAYVEADPVIAPLPAAACNPRFGYVRLHGAPRMYYSAYPPDFLEALAARMAQRSAAGQEVWCVFDNTAEGAAIPNALELQRRLASR